MKVLWGLLLGAITASAQVPSPQIPLTGVAGAGGTFAFLNSGSFAMPNDMDYTVSWPNTSCVVCNITSSVSLTATRNLVEPATGMTFNITNSTTGGQSIVVKAPTGSGVTVPNGVSKWVWFNGTNYVEIDPPAATYPGAGVACSTGSAWCSSYSVGTGANNLVQLNSSAALPAVNGANLTSLNGANLQSGSVANGALTNPSLTINSTSCTLGTSCTISGGTGYSLGGAITSANVVLGTGAGTGATVTVGGVDGAHIISITTGTAPAANGVIYTLTFTAPRNGSIAVLNPAGGGWGSYSSLAQIPFINSVTTTAYHMVAGSTPLTASTGYTFYVSVP